MPKRSYSRSYKPRSRRRGTRVSSRIGYVKVRPSAETRAKYGYSWRSASGEQVAARQSDRYFGRGKYGLRRTLGRFAKRNHLAKRALDAGISYAGGGMYTGAGLYSSNDLVESTADAGSVPSFSSAHDETGSLTVQHREYIRDVYGNPALDGGGVEDFQNQSIELNPGLENSFPWLSQVAQNFEEYEFDQLIFTYRSTIADVNSSNGQVGTVIMSTNYNASEAMFPNKAMMMGYAHSASQKTTEDMLHGVECDPAKLSGTSGKYVRSQGLDPDQDVKTYDHGNFQLAIANTPSGLADNTIGELWVSYTVRLRKPKYHTKEGFGITRDIFRTAGATDQTEWAPMSSGILRGLNGPIPFLAGAHNSLGLKCEEVFEDEKALRITFPAHYAGNLSMKYYLGSNPQELDIDQDPGFTVTTTGNVSKVVDIPGCIQAGISTGLSSYIMASDNDTWFMEQHVRVDIASNSVDNTITFNPNGMDGSNTITSVVLDVSEYNATFGTNLNPAPLFKDANGTLVPYT